MDPLLLLSSVASEHSSSPSRSLRSTSDDAESICSAASEHDRLPSIGDMLLGKSDGLFAGMKLFREEERFLAQLRASVQTTKKSVETEDEEQHGMASPAPSEEGHCVPGRSLSSSVASMLGRAATKEALKRKWGRESSEEAAVVPSNGTASPLRGGSGSGGSNLADVPLLRAGKDGVVAVKRMRARSNSSLAGEVAVSASSWSPSLTSGMVSPPTSSSSLSSWTLPQTPGSASAAAMRGAGKPASASPQPHSRFIFPWLLRNAVASDSGPHRQGLGLFAATHRGVLVRMDHKALLGSQLAEAGLVRQYRKTAALHSQEEIDRHHFEALRRQLELYGFRQVRNPGLSCPQGFLLYEFKFDFPASFPATVPWIERSDEVVNLMINYYRTSKEGLKTNAKQPQQQQSQRR